MRRMNDDLPQPAAPKSPVRKPAPEQKFYEKKWFAPVAAIAVTGIVISIIANMGAKTVNAGNAYTEDYNALKYSVEEEKGSEVFRAIDGTLGQTYSRTHPLGDAWKDLLDLPELKQRLEKPDAPDREIEDMLLREITWKDASLISVYTTSDTGRARAKVERKNKEGTAIITIDYIRKDLWKITWIDTLKP